MGKAISIVQIEPHCSPKSLLLSPPLSDDIRCAQSHFHLPQAQGFISSHCGERFPMIMVLECSGGLSQREDFPIVTVGTCVRHAGAGSIENEQEGKLASIHRIRTFGGRGKNNGIIFI